MEFSTNCKAGILQTQGQEKGSGDIINFFPKISDSPIFETCILGGVASTCRGRGGLEVPILRCGSGVPSVADTRRVRHPAAGTPSAQRVRGNLFRAGNGAGKIF